VNSATVARMSRSRLHLQHGPIDLILDGDGTEDSVDLAFAVATARFLRVLDELVEELSALRSRTEPSTRFRSPIARRMQMAAAQFLPEFSTPMVAVAGAVADEICAAATATENLDRLVVNNGGDIALYLSPETEVRVGLVAGDPVVARPIGVLRLAASEPVRGVATSGWRGRSWSFGIADSATVLAASAATADAGATFVANAVNLPDHREIQRRPAVEVDDNSDLGARLVTVAVGHLSDDEADAALTSGIDQANTLVEAGMIRGAVITLRGRMMTAGRVQIEPLP
jgi:uncharacterized protein